MTSSVIQFFSAASVSPATQLKLNYRERSTELGNALVQNAIELYIQSRLASGLIKLVSPTSVTAAKPEVCQGCASVRCVIISPLSPRITTDIVKSALLRERVKFFSVRRLYGGALEVTVEDSAVVNRLLRDGLVLYNNWFARVRDVTRKRCHTRYSRSVCFLCRERGHVSVMCMRQVPDRVHNFGG